MREDLNDVAARDWHLRQHRLREVRFFVQGMARQAGARGCEGRHTRAREVGRFPQTCTQQNGGTHMTYRKLCTLASVLTLLLVGVTNAMAAAPPKTDICHFQPENGTWKKLSVGGNAPAAHLKNHDDALPGGTTTETGTRLASSCVQGCDNCFGTGHGTGCQVNSCEAAVCAVDPFCCDSDWDGICADEAQTICVAGNLCAAPDCGDCYATGHGPGCQIDSCEAAVCAVDSFCCDTDWDGICAGEANPICGGGGLCPLP